MGEGGWSSVPKRSCHDVFQWHCSRDILQGKSKNNCYHARGIAADHTLQWLQSNW